MRYTQPGDEERVLELARLSFRDAQKKADQVEHPILRQGMKAKLAEVDAALNRFEKSYIRNP